MPLPVLGVVVQFLPVGMVGGRPGDGKMGEGDRRGGAEGQPLGTAPSAAPQAPPAPPGGPGGRGRTAGAGPGAFLSNGFQTGWGVQAASHYRGGGN